MDVKQPRPPRYSIAVTVQIADQLSGRSITGKTSDVSLSGCYVLMKDTPETKSTVRIQLSYKGSTVTAYGDVVRVEAGKGVGLKFRTIAPDQLAVLKRWLFVLDKSDE
jgi:hypothetical protein